MLIAEHEHWRLHTAHTGVIMTRLHTGQFAGISLSTSITGLAGQWSLPWFGQLRLRLLWSPHQSARWLSHSVTE